MPSPRAGSSALPLADETAFFGRAEEVESIARRFAGGARLVTIVGLGGMGKTRLAMAAATRSEHPAIEVALSETRSLDAAIREVARVVGAALAPEARAAAALDVLAKALTKRGPMLLSLDNLEQLGEGARELVTGLLTGAKELRVLATSREPLGVRGEDKLLLAPLEDAEAVCLLRDRARVALDDEQALAIVRRLDGIPLAIELAASRLEVLSAVELLERLTKLDVLGASGSQRTMRATLDWSWDLLSDVERTVLVESSVFAAPFGIEAAEETLTSDREGEDPVLDVLERLMKRSLLLRGVGADGRARLMMFDTVRVWARDKADAGAAIARHARYHLEEAERAALQAYGERAVAALDTLQALLPELLVAFERTTAEQPEVAARIVLALADVLSLRGLHGLRERLVDEGAAIGERTNDGLRARLLVTRARARLDRGAIADAEADLRRALELASAAGDVVTRAEATRSLGWALSAMGRVEEAEGALVAAQAMHRADSCARGLADAHVALAIVRAFQGRPLEALAALREALAIHVEHGDVIRQEKVLGFGSLVGHDARAVARGLPREVLSRAPTSTIDTLPAHVAELVEQETRQSWQQAVDFYRRGATAHERGDGDAAIRLFDQALATLGRAGIGRGVPAVHAHTAVALADLGEGVDARARLERARLAASTTAGELVVEVFAAAVDVIAGGAREAATELLERASRAEMATPELAAATRVLERTLAARPDATGAGGPKLEPSRGSGPALVVGPDARWFTLPRGERVDLVRYGPVRRLLDRLVVARLAEPGVALSADALIQAGWPDERMRHTAGLLRVYSAIRRLRRLGLEPLLVTRDDGYLLDPDAEVRRGSG